MENRRNNQIIQIPTHQQGIGNGAPFRSLPPLFFSDVPFLSASEREHVSVNLPHSIDVDQNFSNVFSLLNLSPSSPVCQIGSSVNVGEGFVYPFKPRLMQSNLAPLVPQLHHQRQVSSNFDYGFDFDQKSNLSSKKFLYSRCSSNHFPAFPDKAFISVNNKPNFQMPDDHRHLNSCYNNTNHHCGLALTKCQNHNFSSSLSLKELRGRIYSLAKDQNGCRILQAMFERPTMEEIEIVLSEVVDCITDLMKDQFGNYLFQKLVVICNDDQKMQLLLSLTKVPTNVILVSMNPHGTRSVQKLLENLKDPIQVELVMKALHRGAAALANDPNGHHVIQYCLVHFHSDINQPILTEIADECFKVATDRSGCCVLQACVEHSRGEVRMRLVAEIMANSVHLAEHPFGNYVLQHMLGLKVPEYNLLLVKRLQGNFASLSCNKYASNVVEKCLNESEEEVATRIVLELIRSPNSSLLLVDPYANFVIQSALKVSKGFVYKCLCTLISKNTSSMRSNLYGKKVLESFEKRRVNLTLAEK